ncbi:MAG: hypothetical protein JRH11_28265 [Deltaproteobacteria bacterium]|nr:hypothetical protein [Deltaproteobacteria bacterium]
MAVVEAAEGDEAVVGLGEGPGEARLDVAAKLRLEGRPPVADRRRHPRRIRHLFVELDAFGLAFGVFLSRGPGRGDEDGHQ